MLQFTRRTVYLFQMYLVYTKVSTNLNGKNLSPRPWTYKDEDANQKLYTGRKSYFDKIINTICDVRNVVLILLYETKVFVYHAQRQYIYIDVNVFTSFLKVLKSGKRALKTILFFIFQFTLNPLAATVMGRFQ